VQVREDGHIAFQVHTVILAVRLDEEADWSAGFGVPETLLLPEIVSILPAEREREPFPQSFDELHFRAPPFANLLIPNEHAALRHIRIKRSGFLTVIIKLSADIYDSRK